MITRQRIINELRPQGVSPIELAVACYKKWNAVPFMEDLSDYLVNGVVVSRPDLFGMAKVIDLAPEGAKEKEPAWFIRMAVGNILTLISELPPLSKICFCRRNDGRVRVYKMDRMIRLAKLSQLSTKD